MIPILILFFNTSFIEIKSIAVGNDIDLNINNTKVEDEKVDLGEIQREIIQTNTEPEKVELSSRIGLIYDRASGRILYEKNGNKQTPMASTTKIMTAIVVIENANLKDTVKIDQKAAGTGGSRLGLKKNDKITVNDLLYGLMLRSGNDAAIALANICWRKCRWICKNDE